MKKLHFCFFLISFLAIFSVAKGNNLPDSLFEEDPYFILMGEAESAIASGNWEEAVLRLNDAIAVDPVNPSNALLYNNLGVAYSCMGQDSLALESFNRSLAIAPRMITPLIGRGRLYLSMNRDKDAFSDFSDAIKIDSINTDARYYHGMMALYGGIMEMAEEDFEILKSIAPRSADTAVALSTLYSMSGRESEAVPYLKKLIENSPSPEFYANLAGCYLQMGWLNEASETIADGLRKYSDDPELYYYRAWLNRDRYRLDDAHRDAKKAVELGANPLKVDSLFR